MQLEKGTSCYDWCWQTIGGRGAFDCLMALLLMFHRIIGLAVKGTIS